jgi:hypothetical protein
MDPCTLRSSWALRIGHRAYRVHSCAELDFEGPSCDNSTNKGLPPGPVGPPKVLPPYYHDQHIEDVIMYRPCKQSVRADKNDCDSQTTGIYHNIAKIHHGRRTDCMGGRYAESLGYSANQSVWWGFSSGATMVSQVDYNTTPPRVHLSIHSCISSLYVLPHLCVGLLGCTRSI